MALLLTNTTGFRAHVILESGVPPQAFELTAGELMGRGSKLLFAPAARGKGKKPVSAADTAFIWDVIENRGWVLNDPLQAYAPVSSSRQFTNVATATAPTGATPEKISGHPCQPAEVTVTAADGTPTVFRVWRAADLQGLPLRAVCPSTGATLTLTLSKVRLEPVPDDLFVPPNSFTKYESSEAIMAELFLRKHNLNRKPTYQPVESEPGEGGTRASPPGLNHHQAINAICLGVRSHSRAAQRPCCKDSVESLHKPPFFMTTAEPALPDTSREISPLR